jgi:hypothetical protein
MEAGPEVVVMSQPLTDGIHEKLRVDLSSNRPHFDNRIEMIDVTLDWTKQDRHFTVVARFRREEVQQLACFIGQVSVYE